MGHYDEIDREIDRELGIRPPDEPSPFARLSKTVGSAAFAAVRYILGWVFFPIIRPLNWRAKPQDDDETQALPATRRWSRRITEAVATRAIITPVILGIFFLGLVWRTTHPARVQAIQTPATLGVYYKKIALTASDGTPVSAWYVPPLTADAVVRDGAAVLANHWPSVVLVHGLGLSHDQYLPLAVQLHEAGFAVLMISTRGQGESGGGAVTFGLRERLDVQAAVRYLRDIPSLDPARICVAGYGTGGQAALQAAVTDASIAAVSVEAVEPSFSAMTTRAFETRFPSHLLAPLYTLTFEMTLREHTNQLDLHALVTRLPQPAQFVIGTTGSQQATRDVLAAIGDSPRRQIHVVDDAPDALPRRDQAIIDFLCQSTKWTPPKDRIPESIQKLIEAQVK